MRAAFIAKKFDGKAAAYFGYQKISGRPVKTGLIGSGDEGGVLVGEASLAVGDRYLVVVGMDFREGEEAMAVAAILHEGRLQRRLDARHLGKIDISLELFVLSRFEIKFLDPADRKSVV